MNKLIRRVLSITVSAAMIMQSPLFTDVVRAGYVTDIPTDGLLDIPADDTAVDLLTEDEAGRIEYGLPEEAGSGDEVINDEERVEAGNIQDTEDDPHTDDADTGSGDGQAEEGGYIEMPWDNDTPVVDRRLDYREAIDMIVDDLPVYVSPDDGYVENPDMFVSEPDSIEDRYPAGNEAEILDYLKTEYPRTRSQNPYGSCWAHSAVALSEFYMISHDLRDDSGMVDNTVDYSELQLAYFCYNQAADPVNGDTGDTISFDSTKGRKKTFMDFGGNLNFASQSMMRYNGVMNDEGEAVYSNAQTVLDRTPGLDDEYSYSKDTVHLKNEYHINIHSNPVLVKQAIKENGIAGVSIYADSKYMNHAKHAYYNDTDTDTNHAVAIVGWDDNYPRTNFKTDPGMNGAWLVRNSWSETSSFSYNSYFWLSYKDSSLNDTAYVFEMADPDSGEYYDNNYNYDSQLHSIVVADSDKTANIFTAVKNSETLKAVQIDSTMNIPGEYTVNIYKNLTDASDPESGTKVTAAETVGTLPFAGKYTITLNSPVTLTEGETFAVVVTTENEIDQENDFIWLEQIDMDPAVNEGESFVFLNDKWADVSERSHGGKYGNVCIRALTDTDSGSLLPDGITALSVKYRTEQSITLAWSSARDAAGYEIWYADAADGIYKKAGRSDALEKKFKHEGLEAGKTYYYKVYPVRNGVIYEGGVSPVVSAMTASATPDVEIVKIGMYQASVRWDRLDCDGYEYTYGQVGGGYFNPKTTTENEITIRQLDPGSEFYIKVRSYRRDGNGNTSYSDFCEIRFTTHNGTCHAVSNLKAQPYSSKIVQLTWDDQEDIWSYELEYSTDNVNFERKAMFRFSDKEPRNVGYATDLTQNTKYYFRIKASLYSFSGSQTPIVYISDPVSCYTKLPAPVSVSAESSNGSINLSWSSVTGANYYSVFRMEKRASEYTPLAVVPASDGCRYTDDTALPGRYYYYRVYGCITNELTEDQGEGSYGYGSYISLDRVDDLSVSQLGSRKAVLSWSAITGAQGYVISKYDDKTEKWKETARVDAGRTEYTLENLIPDTMYRYAVQAYTDDMTGGGVSSAFRTLTGEPAEAGYFTIENNTAVYDGTGHAATVLCSVDEITSAGFEVLYGKKENGSVISYSRVLPVNAGTYQIRIKTEKSTYYSATDLTDESWIFTITPAVYPDKTASGSARYGNSGEVDLSMYVIAGGSLKSTDITVTDQYSILGNTPSVDGNRLKFAFVNSSDKKGKSAVVRVGVDGGANYQDYVIAVTLSVLDKPAQTVIFNSVTAGKVDKIYGAADFTLTASAAGTVSYTSSDSSVATVGSQNGKVHILKAGETTITAVAEATDEYASGSASYVLTVGKAGLTVTANNKTITYGDAPSGNGVACSGFVNGDTESALSGSVSYTYSYTRYGKVGNTYRITPLGLTASNYDITFAPGILTVVKKETGLEWTNTLFTYNGQPVKPAASATGIVNNDVCTVTVTGERTDAGTYTATAVSLSNPNYRLPAAATVSFTIAKAVYGNRTASGMTRYGSTGEVDLSMYITSGGSLKSTGITVDDANGILAGTPSVKGNRLTYAFTDDPAAAGRSVKVTVGAGGGKNYEDYTITVTLLVTECTHEHTELRNVKAATCTKEGYSGDVYCADCGSRLHDGSATLIDPDNHVGSGSWEIRKMPCEETDHIGIRILKCECGHIFKYETFKEEGNAVDEEEMRKLSEDAGTNAIESRTTEHTDDAGNKVEETVISIGDKDVRKTVVKETGTEVETSLWIGGIRESYTYTGLPIRPQLHVYDGMKVLSEGTDYSVSFSNNKDTGDAELTVAFKGNYNKMPKKTVPFKIIAARLGDASVSEKDVTAADIAVAYTGKVMKPVPALTWVSGGKKIRSNDFNYAYSGTVKEAGDYTVTVTPKTGNYSGSATVNITVVKDNEKGQLLSSAEIRFTPDKYIYTGNAIVPDKGKYTVTLGGKTLIEGTHYTVNFSNNTEPGKAEALFTAIEGGGFYGSKKAVFTIKKGRKLTAQGEPGSGIEYLFDASVPYTAKGAGPGLVIKDGDSVLDEGRDYSVKYSRNKGVTNGATAVMTVKGKGKYKGSIKLYYAITARNIEHLVDEGGKIIADDISISDKGYTAPSVTVIDVDGNELKKGKDYEVEALDLPAGISPGDMITLNLKGKGNYTGRVSVSVHCAAPGIMLNRTGARKIPVKKNFTGSKIELSGEELGQILYTGSKSSPQYLVPGKDFEAVGYINNVKRGTARVVLKGKNDFGGIRTLPFKILGRNKGTVGVLIDGVWK